MRDGIITRDIAKAGPGVYDVDELGLDRLTARCSRPLTRSFGGGPVEVLSTPAVADGEEATTVEEVCQALLVRAG